MDTPELSKYKEGDFQVPEELKPFEQFFTRWLELGWITEDQTGVIGEMNQGINNSSEGEPFILTFRGLQLRNEVLPYYFNWVTKSNSSLGDHVLAVPIGPLAAANIFVMDNKRERNFSTIGETDGELLAVLPMWGPDGNGGISELEVENYPVSYTLEINSSNRAEKILLELGRKDACQILNLQGESGTIVTDRATLLGCDSRPNDNNVIVFGDPGDLKRLGLPPRGAYVPWSIFVDQIRGQRTGDFDNLMVDKETVKYPLLPWWATVAGGAAMVATGWLIKRRIEIARERALEEAKRKKHKSSVSEQPAVLQFLQKVSNRFRGKAPIQEERRGEQEIDPQEQTNIVQPKVINPEIRLVPTREERIRSHQETVMPHPASETSEHLRTERSEGKQSVTVESQLKSFLSESPDIGDVISVRQIAGLIDQGGNILKRNTSIRLDEELVRIFLERFDDLPWIHLTDPKIILDEDTRQDILRLVVRYLNIDPTLKVAEKEFKVFVDEAKRTLKVIANSHGQILESTASKIHLTRRGLRANLIQIEEKSNGNGKAERRLHVIISWAHK